MSCFLLALLTQTGAALFSSSTVDFAVAYWASSIATTLLLTILIVARLMYLRHRIHSTLGPDHKSPYLSISAMLVESALLDSVYTLIYLVLSVKNDPFQNIVFPLLGQVQAS